MDNRLDCLLNGLVQETRNRQEQQQTEETSAEDEYQEAVRTATDEKELREMLPNLRAIPGRDY